MNRSIVNGVVIAVTVLTVAVGGPWLLGHVRSLPDARVLAARAQGRVVTLEVGGMTCSGCEGAVKTELDQVPGVTATEVRHRQSRAYVVADKAVPDSALIAAVRRAGGGFAAVVVDK
jgi:copper chaperone